MSVGVAAGMIAGLFGMGGGVVVVPALIVVFDILDIDKNIATHLALGTSLATVLVNTASASRVHLKRKAIHKKVFLAMAPFVFAGSAIGSQLAHFMSGYSLQLLCGLSAILVALKMFLTKSASKKQDSNQEKSYNSSPWTAHALSGLTIGCLSGMLGIGGGALSVPWLTLTGMPVPQAIATASGLGFTLAIAGTAGYTLAGSSLDLQIPYTLGYVYLPAFFGIISTSYIFARIGAKLAHQTPVEILQKIFSIMLLFIGSKFIFSGLKGIAGL